MAGQFTPKMQHSLFLSCVLQKSADSRRLPEVPGDLCVAIFVNGSTDPLSILLYSCSEPPSLNLRHLITMWWQSHTSTTWGNLISPTVQTGSGDIELESSEENHNTCRTPPREMNVVANFELGQQRLEAATSDLPESGANIQSLHNGSLRNILECL